MKSICFLLAFLGIVLNTSAQYANGRFLSLADFSTGETSHFSPIRQNLDGRWFTEGNQEFVFNHIGNAILITIVNADFHNTGYHEGEIAGLLTYTGGSNYNLAIRIKHGNHSEEIQDIPLSYRMNQFSDQTNTYVIQRLNAPSTSIAYIQTQSSSETYFRQPQRKKKKNKNKRGVFRSLLSGAGSLFTGAAKAYASSETPIKSINELLNNPSVDDIMSLLEDQLDHRNSKEASNIRNMIDQLDLNDTADLEQLIRYVLESGESTPDDPGSIWDAIEKNTDHSKDNEDFFNRYATDYWANFEKNYGDQLRKLKLIK